MHKRKLAGLESIFYRTPEANVALVARLRGTVEEDRLRRALQQAASIYPLLRAHCVEEQGAVWLVTADAVDLPLKIIARTGDAHWQTALQAEHAQPFDFEHGPLIRFVLLQSPDVSDLLIFGQHLICDGLSLVNLAETLLKYMAGDSSQPAPEVDPALPIPANLPLGGAKFHLMGLVKNLFINRFNSQWQAAKITLDASDFRTLQRTFSQHYQYRLVMAELGEAETEQLVTACRAHQVTVNSALSVAFMAGRLEVLPSYTNPNLASAINIRDRLKQPVGPVVGCYASTLEFKYAYQPALDFWANAHAFHALVQARLQDKQDLVSLTDIARMSTGLMSGLTFARHVAYSPEVVAADPKLAALGAESKNIAAVLARDGAASYPGLLITNLGALKHADPNAGLRLEKFYFAPSAIPVPEGSLILGVVTLNQKMVITLNAWVSQGETGESTLATLTAIKEKTLAQIQSMIS